MGLARSLLLPGLWGHKSGLRLHTQVPTLDCCSAVASPLVLPSQGCYTVILNTFETYVYLAGALAIGVLAIEVSKGPTSVAPQKQDTLGV